MLLTFMQPFQTLALLETIEGGIERAFFAMIYGQQAPGIMDLFEARADEKLECLLASIPRTAFVIRYSSVGQDCASLRDFRKFILP